jgi:hypothetical protein
MVRGWKNAGKEKGRVQPGRKEGFAGTTGSHRGVPGKNGIICHTLIRVNTV